MPGDDGAFWDRRYREEGAIWGDDPSPSAELLARHTRAGDRVLDVGFGYGRDLVFLGRRGCRVSGVEMAGEGFRRAARRLAQEGLRPDRLEAGRFGSLPAPADPFDAIVCHRLVHLLVEPGEAEGFVAALGDALRPGGLLVVGARSPKDFDPAAMVPVGDGVVEYRHRPGHRLRFWSPEAFDRSFGGAFTVLDLAEADEPESRSNPVPCRLTVMLARKEFLPRGSPSAGAPAAR